MQSLDPPRAPAIPEPQFLRVLVVEDEPEALTAMLEMIAVLGHWATGVSTAEGARDRFIEGAFDVLLTDVALPALSGFDLVDILRARHPVQVIFASGKMQPATLDEDTVWLQKPFGIDALSEALERAQRRLAS